MPALPRGRLRRQSCQEYLAAQNDILPALKGGISPQKESVIFASIHPRDESRGFLEAQNKKNGFYPQTPISYKLTNPRQDSRSIYRYFEISRSLLSAEGNHIIPIRLTLSTIVNTSPLQYDAR